MKFSARTMSILQGRGALVVFEGCDRSGKSTQCKLLHESLTAQGCTTKLFRFPDRSTPIGDRISKYLKKEIELDDKAIHKMFSDNRRELESSMKEELAKGTTLIVDRYAFSGVAYSAAKGLDYNWCRSTDAGLIAPDMVFFLDVSPSDVSSRGGFGDERYETDTFQNKVLDIYELLKEPEWKIIDGNRNVEDIHLDIKKEFDLLLPTISSSKIERLWGDLIAKDL